MNLIWGPILASSGSIIHPVYITWTLWNWLARWTCNHVARWIYLNSLVWVCWCSDGDSDRFALTCCRHLLAHGVTGSNVDAWANFVSTFFAMLCILYKCPRWVWWGVTLFHPTQLIVKWFSFLVHLHGTIVGIACVLHFAPLLDSMAAVVVDWPEYWTLSNLVGFHHLVLYPGRLDVYVE